jgi:acetyltransferase-like isoleucine patch superfamily enzyme
MKPIQAYRLWRLRRSLGHCGERVIFNANSVFTEPERVKIADDVFIGEGVHLGGAVTIGERVMFGPRVKVFAGNHVFDGGPPRFRAGTDEPVTICADAWIGGGAIILGGVTVGERAVVGAGSVVTGNVGPYCVVAGNPARFIRPVRN